MSEPTDIESLIRDLKEALPLLVRDATAAAMAAGTLPGAHGLALAERLREIAATELEDVERVAARIASLVGRHRSP